MKNVKKILLISGVAFTIASCGSKVETKETTTSEVAQVETCPCSEIYELKGIAQKGGKAYSGSCEELDQHSVATTHKNFINGILVAHYHKKRTGDSYVTYDSLTWESGKPFNGYRTTADGRVGVGYITSVREFKDGKLIFDGKIDISISSITNRLFYYDYIDRSREFVVESPSEGDFKSDLISFLERVKKVNPRFEFTVEQ